MVLLLHIAVLAKLNLAAMSAHGSITPCVASLIWPFLLKFSFSFRPIQQACVNMLFSSRLFFFQLARIVFDPDEVGPIGVGNRNRRWSRALRLVSERMTVVSRWHEYETDEDSLRNLSMLTL